jgi:hypothetical protein
MVKNKREEEIPVNAIALILFWTLALTWMLIASYLLPDCPLFSTSTKRFSVVKASLSRGKMSIRAR